MALATPRHGKNAATLGSLDNLVFVEPAKFDLKILAPETSGHSEAHDFVTGRSEDSNTLGVDSHDRQFLQVSYRHSFPLVTCSRSTSRVSEGKRPLGKHFSANRENNRVANRAFISTEGMGK